MFKYLSKFKHREIKDLPQEFLIERFAVNTQFLENKKGGITVGEYFLSILEIVISV